MYLMEALEIEGCSHDFVDGECTVCGVTANQAYLASETIDMVALSGEMNLMYA